MEWRTGKVASYGQAPGRRLRASGMKVNGCESTWIGRKEIDRIPFHPTGCRQVEQRTGTGTGPDGVPAGIPPPLHADLSGLHPRLVRRSGRSEKEEPGPL